MSETQNFVEHEGFIINKENSYYNIRIIVKSACSACHIKGACSLSDITEKIIQVKDVGESYEENEKVMIVMKSSLGLKAVFLGYVIPFIIIMLSLIIALKFVGDEGLAAGIALLMTGLYYLILYLRKDALKKSFSYRIRKIIS